VPTKNGEAPQTAVDDVDAGWEDDEEEEAEAADPEDGDVDAGWDAVEAAKTPEERERAWRGLTPEQREAHLARAAARKEKLRAKAAAKAERRKSRASFAKAKQKQKIQRPRTERPTRRALDRADETSAVRESAPSPESAPMRARRNDPRVLAFLVAIVLLAGGIALFLWRR
jgi:hypothetical protein